MIFDKRYFVWIFFALLLGNFPQTVSAAEDAETSAPSLAAYVQQGEEAVIAGEENENTEEETTSDENKTWFNNLVTTAAEKGSAIITSNKEKDNSQRRSNASVFDISGVMLRMSQEQTQQALTKRGYRKTYEKLEIPNFIQWRYEEICRNQGVIGYERINNCVVLMAKKNNYQFVQHQTYANFKNNETIDVFYTSNFTGNKVHRIMYSSEAANIKGAGAKADYLRNLKIYDFWKKVNQKYGAPDNQEQIIWGLGDNKPSLQASTGKLILQDPMLRELDFTRMSREDQKFMNTAFYTF